MQKTRLTLYLLLSVFYSLLLFPACGRGKPKLAQTQPMTLGAYYSTAPADKNSLRQKLVPVQEPVLGPPEAGRNEAAIKQHLVWANQSGVDFFITQWWGQGTASDTTIKGHFSPHLIREKSQTKFCIWYLTPYLHKTLNYEISLDQTSEAQILANFSYIARNYFNHPNYFHIDNRPVVFLYLSRYLSGDYAKTFRRLRDIIKQQTKKDIYLVGDEIFWTEPVKERIREMDAITVYNMYGPDRYAGYAGERGFLKDIDEVFGRYHKIAEELKIGFIPNVMPGFNDRGIPETGRLRLQDKHYVIPRTLSLENKEEGSFYRAYFQVAKKHLDNRLNLIAINSWNDWQQDTQIEPVKPNIVSAKHPPELTGGYEYNAYGEIYLDITRQEKASNPSE